MKDYYLLPRATFTTARAEYYANIIKEKANLRKLIELGEFIIDEVARGIKSPSEISLSDFFANHFDSGIEQVKAYSERTSGFDNLDQYQFFHPGLYVIGAIQLSKKFFRDFRFEDKKNLLSNSKNRIDSICKIS